MTIARRVPLPKKRATPRTHRCSGCGLRLSALRCPDCGTRKATKRGNIGKRCDALWSQLIRAPGYCLRCRTTLGLQAAHIVGRAQRVVRWDPTNGICLCIDCHRAFDTYRLDREALIFQAIGADAARALYIKARGVWSKEYPLAELTAALAQRRTAA